MRKILNAFIIVVCLFFASCATGRITTLDRQSNEAIILAKIQIKNGDTFIGNKWSLLLDERVWGKWAVKPDENNYIYMKVPVGEHFVAMLQYNRFHKNIPDNYLTIDVMDNGIYYIGDIVINWTIDPNTDGASSAAVGGVLGGALGAVIGAVADSKRAGDYLKVDIIDNFDETTSYLATKFLYDQKINKSLLKVQE